MRKLVIVAYATALLVTMPALAAPLPPTGPVVETCGFLPVETRMSLPPEHPCHLPPATICADERGQPSVCPY